MSEDKPLKSTAPKSTMPKGKINDIVDLKDGTNYVVTAHLVGKPVSKKAVQIVNQGVITWAKKK